MLRRLWTILWVGSLATCLYVLWSQNRVLELQLAHSRRAANAAEVAANEQQVLDAATAERLREELRAAIVARDHVASQIDQARDELVSSREQQHERMRRATAPPPEGVRLAILTLNERFREAGYPGLRLLHAERIDKRSLFGVEMSEHRADLLSTSVYRAEEVRFELDRTAATLTVRLLDGVLFVGGTSRELPPEGDVVELQDVDGEMWEATLPFLVRGRGRYPEVGGSVVGDGTGVPFADRATVLVWMERLDALLAEAETEVAYRVGVMRDVHDGAFRGVSVHGYDERKQLAVSMRSASLEVVVDARDGVVELLLKDGVLLRAGGETPIPQNPGYRILLPGIEEARARTLMLGMVTTQGS